MWLILFFLSFSHSLLFSLHSLFFPLFPLPPPPCLSLSPYLSLSLSLFGWHLEEETHARTIREGEEEEARRIYYGAVAGLILRLATSIFPMCDTCARTQAVTLGLHAASASVSAQQCWRIHTYLRVNGYYSRQMYYGFLNSTRHDETNVLSTKKYFYATTKIVRPYDIRPDYQNQIIHGHGGVSRPEDTRTHMLVYRNAARSNRINLRSIRPRVREIVLRISWAIRDR